MGFPYGHPTQVLRTASVIRAIPSGGKFYVCQSRATVASLFDASPICSTQRSFLFCCNALSPLIRSSFQLGPFNLSTYVCSLSLPVPTGHLAPAHIARMTIFVAYAQCLHSRHNASFGVFYRRPSTLAEYTCMFPTVDSLLVSNAHCQHLDSCFLLHPPLPTTTALFRRQSTV